MDFAKISEIGNRRQNEDTAAVFQKDGAVLFVVCDGLGGHNKGEVASGAVACALGETLKNNEEFGEEFFSPALSEAKDKIKKMITDSSAYSGMRTTVCSLLIKNGTCSWCHVGDSRLYAFKKGKLVFCTKDHSVPQMLVEKGEIRFREIRRHPDRNKLLRAMGEDFSEEQAEYSPVEREEDFDAFLLCSDGFWELINERKMCTLLRHSNNAAEWLNGMTEAVKHKGRRVKMDNFSAVAVFLNGKEGK